MRPMLATADTLPVGPQWAYECKWDGIRLLARVKRGAVRPHGRNESDLTERFPELADLGNNDALGTEQGLLLDGELIMLDPEGRPSFAALAPHINRQPEQHRTANASPRALQYVVFDLLARDGRDLTGEPFSERRRQLLDLQLQHPLVRVAETFADGAALWAATREQQLEGVVAKRWDSRYEPGARSRSWIKAAHRATQDFVIVGWPPQRDRSQRVGALVLADVRPNGLELAGAVGAGISEQISAAILPVLTQIEAAVPSVRTNEAMPGPHTRGATPLTHWVQPLLIAEVRYLHRTAAGQLRHPALLRLRPDLTPADLARCAPTDRQDCDNDAQESAADEASL